VKTPKVRKAKRNVVRSSRFLVPSDLNESEVFGFLDMVESTVRESMINQGCQPVR
jgi:hypothetical protein